MAQACSICIHPDRAKIEHAVLVSLPLRHVASLFKVGYKSIDRHKDHMAALTAKAVAKREDKAADTFLDSITSTITSMGKGVDAGMKALADNKVEAEMAFRMAPAYAAQGLRAIELLGRATGRLSDAQVTAQATHIVILGGQVAIDQRGVVTDEADRVTVEPTQQLDDGHTIDIKALGNS